MLLPFSRTQESEADTLGQRYMAQAGFDPRAAVTLWDKMGAQGGSKPPAFLSTHPASGNRAKALNQQAQQLLPVYQQARANGHAPNRSEEHTSELQSLMRISYAVFCLKKKNNKNIRRNYTNKQNQNPTQQVTNNNNNQTYIDTTMNK